MKWSMFLVSALTLLLTASPVAFSKSYDIPNISMYEDGASCPNGCDSHVVISDLLNFNGSIFAFSPPLTSRWASPKKCSLKSGEDAQCVVCFDRSDESCIQVRYRGAGPHPWTFDFTPAFFHQWCDDPKAPKRLQFQCRDWRKKASRYTWNDNCLKGASSNECKSLIKESQIEKDKDKTFYEECLLGERVFNEKYNKNGRNDLVRRNKCAYFENKFVSNKADLSWRRLAPAACGVGTFVGEAGTDCCTGDLFRDVAFGWHECRKYYPGGVVMPIQQILQRIGYAVVPDGVYGASTRLAIRKFQYRMKMKEDGEPTPELLDALKRFKQ